MVNCVGSFRTVMGYEAYQRIWYPLLPSHSEKEKSPVNCPEFGLKIQKDSFSRHRRFVHIIIGDQLSLNQGMNEWRHSVLDINSHSRTFPKEGCPCVASCGSILRHHIKICHPKDSVIFRDQELFQCGDCIFYMVGNPIPKKNSESKT